MSVALLFLVSVLAVAVSKTNGNFRQAWTFYTAVCSDSSTSQIDTLLHLLINIVSTIVLASSNFFMQVLNAPSRREVDTAHARGIWLDIGVPSWRNAFYLSRFKLAAWISLFLTSIPIHLLFNSSVFQTTSLMGDFHLTVAAEGFLSGGNYSFPGASLFTRGLAPGIVHLKDFGFGNIEFVPSFWDLGGNYYVDHTANVSKAAAQAGNWKRLNTNECRTIYGTNCTGLREYRNVIVVTEGPGWRRSDLWILSAYADSLWEPVVPRNETNTLWYATQCKMGMEPYGGSVPKCDNNCDSILSDYPANLDSEPNGTWLVPLQRWYPDIPPTHINIDKNDDPWSSKRSANYSIYHPWGTPVSSLGFRSYFERRFDSDALKISYCLAESGDCKSSVALSKPLFLAVVLSVLSKLIICIVTVRVLGSEEALVTPGNAISSFISIQEGQTSVSGFLTQELVLLRVLAREEDAEYTPLGPQQWHTKLYRQERGRAITADVWRRTYFVLIFGVVVSIVLVAVQIGLGIPL
ncbi:hypothetical protein CMUS01_01773 [Colletotrichum musicola]|uniref:DUF6536 domain-containing protein n=1 Tax=Colletotrichum musicola TaxID=2175873 RepID=A0A8H6U7R5_9PEZI|nr:hypothetical protein CMUS01_01773 [Colletotrichum musicola]